MDVRHPLTEHDQSMLELASSRGLPVHILLTKADKLGRGAASNALQLVQRRAARGWEGQRAAFFLRSTALAYTKRAVRSNACSTGCRKKKPRRDQRIRPGQMNPVLGDDRARVEPREVGRHGAS
jgi:hypothetical protein